MTRTRHIRVGTRGSQLACVQTDWVVRRLAASDPTLTFEVTVIRTAGDEDPNRVPARFSGKGIFTREIEAALLAERIDLAVHSLKDLPAECPDGLALGAIPARENPMDALVGCPLDDLVRTGGAGLTLGTSSLRRGAQLRRAFPACTVVNFRGNLDTRLRKVADGEVDGAVLAASGLRRLGRGADIGALFTADRMLPAPGQGALGIEIRAADAATREILQALHCEQTARCVDAERAFMHALGGGCQVPVAALACIDGEILSLHGRVLSIDGAQVFEARTDGAAATPTTVGAALARTLAAQGAAAVLRDIEAALQQERDHG